MYIILNKRAFKNYFRIALSGTERYMCCVEMCNNNRGLNDKTDHRSAKLYQKNFPRFILLALVLVLCTRNNTENSKQQQTGDIAL